MARAKSPLEPLVEDFIRNHPLTLDWPTHERRAFVRELATFMETRFDATQRRPKSIGEILE